MKSTIYEIMKKMTVHEKVMICTGKNSWRTMEYEHLGIPSIVMSDGTNGVRFQKGSDGIDVKEINFYESLDSKFDSEDALNNTHEATCFPTGSAIACSWNKELIQEMGVAIAHECQKLGIHLLLGPGMNTRRHPLTARNFEYYSEDPCLAGDMASSLVEGVQSQGVGTCIKHFACHNSDTRRTRVNSIMNERALREIYLACFERVIKKASPTCVMTAYNQVNGIETSGDSPLLKDILRGEWGFRGATICDWGSVKDVVEASKGSVDLQMPCSLSSAKRLEEAVLKGELEEAYLDKRVENILRLVFKLTSTAIKRDIVDYKKHHELARTAAKESITLLKNKDDILPISTQKIKKLAVIGRLAKKPLYQGTGCAIVNAKTIDIPLEYIDHYCKDKIELQYAEGYTENGEADENIIREAVKTAGDADVVIVFVGAFLPEESDDYNRKHMNLENGQEALINALAEVNQNIIVVLANGDSVLMPWVHEVKAVLDVWYSGEGMGSAVADILFGAVNPSGKLSATIPVKMSDTPSYLAFPGNHYDLEYNEGVYVGYRYYDKKEIEPLFEFGYGLSYTSFEYSNLKVSELSLTLPNLLKVSLDIKNTGDYFGKEIIQLYVSEMNPKQPRPLRELKGFEKIDLKPGEIKNVEFILEERDFSYYNPDLKAWIADSNIYYIEIGASSRDIKMSCPVNVINNKRMQSKLRRDCGFHELFANEAATGIFLDFLLEHGLVTEEQANDGLIQQLKGTFWPVSVFLDMNSGGIVTYEMMDELIDHMNEVICRG